MTRPVQRSAAFVERVHEHFPPGGDSAGRPSFELFVERILLIAERRMATGFDELPETIAGTAIRFVMTHSLPFFPPLVIYGMLVIDSLDEHVELIDITIDDDYFEELNNKRTIESVRGQMRPASKRYLLDVSARSAPWGTPSLAQVRSVGMTFSTNRLMLLFACS